MTGATPTLAQIKHITGFDFVFVPIVSNQLPVSLENVAKFIACPFQAIFSRRAFPNPGIAAFVIAEYFQPGCAWRCAIQRCRMNTRWLQLLFYRLFDNWQFHGFSFLVRADYSEYSISRQEKRKNMVNNYEYLDFRLTFLRISL